MKTYAIDQFFDKFYRPDIIATKVKGEDITKLVKSNIKYSSKTPPEIEVQIQRIDGFYSSGTGEIVKDIKITMQQERMY